MDSVFAATTFVLSCKPCCALTAWGARRSVPDNNYERDKPLFKFVKPWMCVLRGEQSPSTAPLYKWYWTSYKGFNSSILYVNLNRVSSGGTVAIRICISEFLILPLKAAASVRTSSPPVFCFTHPSMLVSSWTTCQCNYWNIWMGLILPGELFNTFFLFWDCFGIRGNPVFDKIVLKNHIAKYNSAVITWFTLRSYLLTGKTNTAS